MAKGIHKKLECSDALAEVIGVSSISRPELMKAIWVYIKRHGLQDEKNRRMIRPDEALAEVFGSSKAVSMFEMTKKLSKHLS